MLSINDCVTTILLFQIVDELGGLQLPSHELEVEHITCESDDVMGNRIKFTIHRDQDDDTVLGQNDRQR
jgi:hypothetical protein